MTTRELIQKAYSLDLEGVHILDKYSVEEIGKIYNGIGPDRFPDWLRKIVTESAELFEAAALIHDVEYDEGGTREQFSSPRRMTGFAGTATRWSKTGTAGMTSVAISG